MKTLPWGECSIARCPLPVPGLLLFLLPVACAPGPTSHVDAGPSPDCTVPEAAGCPCEATEPVACYEGPEGTLGVGLCRAGLRTCTGGFWGACIGQILPHDDVVNGLDEDCDGEVDERLGEGCDDDLCGGSCEEITMGIAGADWRLGEGAGVGVEVGADRCLHLEETTTELHVIWIANSLDGTISKVDTRSKEELARYRTGPLGESSCYWCGPGDNPSRSSVSTFGDVYVANRAFGGQGSATKILFDDCPDADGDGAVETSGAGDDVHDFGEDECVAWNVPVGPSLSLPRAIVVDERLGLDGVREERAWVGIFEEHRFHALDGESGAEIEATPDLSPGTPYGAAIDRDGIVWFATLTNLLGWFDSRDPDAWDLTSQPPGHWNYGITIDPDGDVWVAGTGVFRYRPRDAEWDSAGAFPSRGIAATPDGTLFTHDDEGLMGRVDPVDLTITPMEGRGGRGVAVDSDGIVWFVNWDQGPDDDGDVALYDPNEPEAGLATCCDFVSSPYTYSDMTGMQRFWATRPSGAHDAVVPPCEPDAEAALVSLSWDAELPAGTSLRFEARGAPSLPELSDAEWTTFAAAPDELSPVDVSGRIEPIASGVFEVRTVLESRHREASPSLCAWSVVRRCDRCLR